MRKLMIGLLTLMLLCIAFLFKPLQEAQAASEPEVVDNNAIRVTEVLDLRDSRSKTYKLSDGSYEWVGYAQDVHYRDQKGKYQQIDNSIVRDNLKTESVDYKYKNKANSFTVRFGDMADSSVSPVYIEYQGKSIAFAPVNGKASSAEKTKNANSEMLSEIISDTESCMLYKDIYPGVDLMYEVKTSGIKEYIILNQPFDTNTFEFDLKLEGLQVKEEDGGIQFVDDEGNPIFSIGDLIAVDDNGALAQDIKCTISNKNGSYRFSLTVDEGYLSHKNRVYPIVIDPSVMIAGSSVTFDSYVSSKLPTRNFYLESYLRTGSDEPYGARRTYIKFTLPTNIPGGNVTSAYLRMEKRTGGANPVIKAYRVKSNWSSDTIKWNNKPDYEKTLYVSPYADNDSGAWWRMNTLAIVRRWLDGTYNNYGFLVKDNTETGTEQWTTFYSSDKSSPHKPELHIYYTGTSLSITYNGNGNTGGSAPANQSVTAGQSIALRTNTGNLTKAGACPLLGWNTNSAGTGTNYSLGQTITPTTNLTLYAKWGSPIYSYHIVFMKLWVDKTYTDYYSDWFLQADDIATKASYPFYQTYNLNIIISAPTQMVTPKSQCINTPNKCTIASCGSDCNNHHTNASKLLAYVSNNGSSSLGLNTLFYYGETSCYNGNHEEGVGGLAYLPWSSIPGHQASMVQCYSSSNWPTIRRVQHEWSHNYGARHSGDGGTCTSNCINNGGWDNILYEVPDVWCSRCKNAMAPYLENYN
ncbi:MAG: DNRLRE domain-containing protein [Christensenellales bacterium]